MSLIKHKYERSNITPGLCGASELVSGTQGHFRCCGKPESHETHNQAKCPTCLHHFTPDDDPLCPRCKVYVPDAFEVLLRRARSFPSEADKKLLGVDLVSHLRRQHEWSERTFGPGNRTVGVLDHIRKELKEIEAAPLDLSEWIDVAILALDGAWRAGYSPEEIAAALVAKQTKNEARTWPDWRTAPQDKAIEHDRTSI